MKRSSTITVPKGQVPEIYKSHIETINSDDVDVNLNENIEIEIPPKQLRSYNLKKIKSFKAIRHKYKLSNQSKLFQNDLQVLLNEYLPQNYQLDTELLIHILNIAEQFFIYGSKNEREEQKTASVKKLMLQYFRDDEELLDSMIGLVWHKVNKSNFLKRFYYRMKNKFFLN